MRNLADELKAFNLHAYQIQDILKWINTLTNQDLSNNGSEHAYFPAGYEKPLPIVGYESVEDYYSLDSRIDRWIKEKLPQYKSEVYDKPPYLGGKVYMVRDLRNEFDLSLVESLRIVRKIW